MGLRSIPTREYGQQITKAVSVGVDIRLAGADAALRWPRALSLESQNRKIAHIKIEQSRRRHFGRSADTSADRRAPTAPRTNASG
jgi:hypothetical protein